MVATCGSTRAVGCADLELVTKLIGPLFQGRLGVTLCFRGMLLDGAHFCVHLLL